MNSPQPTRFDTAALYAALNARRTARGLSWEGAAREIGGRISTATLRRTKLGLSMETDGMLAIVRWLRRSPESFILGPGKIPKSKPFDPATADLSVLRFDTPALYAALLARRQERGGMHWTAIAGEVSRQSAIPLSTGQIARLEYPGRVDVAVMVALVRWLGVPIATFTRLSIR